MHLSVSIGEYITKRHRIPGSMHNLEYELRWMSDQLLTGKGESVRVSDVMQRDKLVPAGTFFVQNTLSLKEPFSIHKDVHTAS